MTLPTSVVRRLRLYKAGGKTYAEVIEELMDTVPPQSFLDWAEQELKREAVDYSKVRAQLGVPAR